MVIEFNFSSKAYLPELVAYQEYFMSLGYGVELNNSKDRYSKSDIIWKFMGIDIIDSDKPTIHEYGSLSTGAMPKLKDYLKSCLSSTPSGRIFLNPFVYSALKFKKKSPILLRDMGIHRSFFEQKRDNKRYDCVYAGSISNSRTIGNLCRHFKYNMVDKSLLLIGEPERAIHKEYESTSNIIFTGKLPYNEVAALASQAEHGINFTPNIYPYSYQTSTKVLEYCALGLNVITTQSHWVNQFAIENNASFLGVDSNLNCLTKKSMEQFSYRTPDVSPLEWNRMLNNVALDDWVQTVAGKNS